MPREAPPSFEARILPGKDDLAEAAAEELRSAAEAAIAEFGVFRVALSGGSTPRIVHERLVRAPFRRGIDWRRTRFFFGDERCVAPDSDRSNYRMARETLFEPLGIPADRIFRMRGEDPPKAAAEAYSRLLEKEFAEDGGEIRFDFVFLGLGPDGHTASLFPGTRALEQRSPAAANWVPKFREWRLTLTYPVLNAARRTVFLVAGEEKAGPATAILKRQRGFRALPASAVQPRNGSLIWLLDQDAGAKI